MNSILDDIELFVDELNKINCSKQSALQLKQVMITEMFGPWSQIDITSPGHPFNRFAGEGVSEDDCHYSFVSDIKYALPHIILHEAYDFEEIRRITEHMYNLKDDMVWHIVRLIVRKYMMYADRVRLQQGQI